MGKVSFKSPEKKLPASPDKVYDFISDLRNFEPLMPDKVEKWSADRDRCEFTISGLSTFSMEIVERDKNKVVLTSGDITPVDFELRCNILESKGETQVEIELEAELSPMIKMMASRPLQNLVDIMAEKLGEQFES
jgi:carbon monoxide dehydrogenase subunit G